MEKNNGADSAWIDYDKLEAAIESLKGDASATLQELMAMDSAAEAGEGDAPYGEGVKAVFERVLKLASADGFETEQAEWHGGHIEFGGLIIDSSGEIIGTSEEVLGILCRLDTLPTGPGRGAGKAVAAKTAIDRAMAGKAAPKEGPPDEFGHEGKAAAVACYYAMKALAGSGFMPEKKVRLIMCLDGELGGVGLGKYFQRFKAPETGFSVDGDFPASCGRMGRLVFGFAKKLGKPGPKGLLLRSLSGGVAANVVPGQARAVVRGDRYEDIKDKAALYREETGRAVYIKGVGKSLEIKAQGVAAHGAAPESGVNAISVLIDFMSKLTFASEDVQEFLEFYSGRIGFEHDGASLNCGFSDEVSGRLRLNPGMISGDDKAIMVTLSAYCPVSVEKDDVYGALLPALDENDMGLIKISCVRPSYEPEGPASRLAVRLSAVYRAHTGDSESKPIVSPGALIAPEANIGVAFGPRFPGEKEGVSDKIGHVDDERFFQLVKIYAEAIAQLSVSE